VGGPPFQKGRETRIGVFSTALKKNLGRQTSKELTTQSLRGIKPKGWKAQTPTKRLYETPSGLVKQKIK